MRVMTLLGAAAAVACASALAQDAGAPAYNGVPAAQPPAASAPPVAKAQDQMLSEARRGNLSMPPPPRGRYSFAPVDDGFLRFDHNTGEVAHCRGQKAGWNCTGVPGSDGHGKQDVAALSAEIDALKKQVADAHDVAQQVSALRDQVTELQKQIAALKPPPPAPPPPPAADKGHGITIQMPSKQDIARARGFIEYTWQRLIDMIATLQRDMLRKGNEAANGLSRT